MSFIVLLLFFQTDSLEVVIKEADQAYYSIPSDTPACFDLYQKGADLAKASKDRAKEFYCNYRIISLLTNKNNHSEKCSPYLARLNELSLTTEDSIRYQILTNRVRMQYLYEKDSLEYADDLVWSFLKKLEKDHIPLELKIMGYEQYAGYHDQVTKDFKTSIIWFKKALDLLEVANDTIKNQYNFILPGNLGYVYESIGDNQTAIEYYQVALKNMTNASYNTYQNQTTLYDWMAGCFSELGQLDSAFYYATLSKATLEKSEQAKHNNAIKEIEDKYQNQKLKTNLLEEETAHLKTQSQLQKRRIYIFLLAGLLVLGMIGSFIYHQFQKKIQHKNNLLQEQRKINERQRALEKERNRIASEMHDDLGGGLTTIKFISQKALRKIKSEEDRHLISKISDQSNQLVNNMSEIIWAMNSRFDDLDNLVAYMRQYANQFFEPYDLDLKFTSNVVENNIKLSGEKRRNLFLVVKEILHNIVKHAEATKVEINVSLTNALIIEIRDNGKGMDLVHSEFGNGILNMTDRINNLGGLVNIFSSDGTRITLEIPVNKLQSS